MPQKGQITSSYIHLPYEEWKSKLVEWLKCHPLIKPQKRHLKESFWQNMWKKKVQIGLMKNILTYSGEKPAKW